ncbi:ABC transporter permease [Streptomyces sp. NPDC049954]|uniref:ABC transporter permease n=1 Tax=Streptomyces sp. NPDC049954 TaxID=3155779 RepID=UPI003428A096
MTDLLSESSTVPADEAALSAPRKGRRRLSRKLTVGLTLVGLIVLFGVIAPFLVQDPRAVSDLGLAGPSSAHWLGTTQTGQDVLAQLAYGTRGSLLVGAIVGVLTTVLSAFFGIVGPYLGGFVDELFSLISNVMLILPGLPLMIVISGYVHHKSIMLTALVLALTGWAAGARVLRGQTLSVRGRDYVLASRISGEKTWRVICVEILPNLLPVLSSGFVFSIIFAILGEAGLSFIGVGATGSITWGTMLGNAQNGQALLLGGWWWFVPPGLLIALLGCGLSLINFSNDEVINPRLRAPRARAIRKAAS